MGQQYDLIIYRKMTNPYARFIKVGNGQIWDVAAGALAAAPTYGNTDVQLTPDNTYIGGTPVKIPATLPVGDYDMLIYDAATPAVADVPVLGKRIAWSGKGLIGLPLEL